MWYYSNTETKNDTVKIDFTIQIISCFVLAPVAGLTTACDSLLSQTIRGKNKTLVGKNLQTGRLFVMSFWFKIMY